MSATAVVELREALASLFAGDSATGGMADLTTAPHVYALQARPGASPSYAIIGPVPVDTDASYLNGQSGRRHKRRLTFWARSPGLAEAMYARAVTLLDKQLFTIEGHTMQSASLDMNSGPVQDEDKKLWGVYADWTVRTMQT